jgi:hypothetical protein
MLEIDEQVSRMLDLVVERKLRLNKIGKPRCLDNEEDEDDKKCIDKPKQLEECCCAE